MNKTTRKNDGNTEVNKATIAQIEVARLDAIENSLRPFFDEALIARDAAQRVMEHYQKLCSDLTKQRIAIMQKVPGILK